MTERKIAADTPEARVEWDGYQRRVSEVRRPTLQELSKSFVLNLGIWVFVFLLLRFFFASSVGFEMLWGGVIGLLIAHLWWLVKGRVPTDG